MAGAGGPARRRALARLAAGTPVLPALVVVAVLLADLAGDTGTMWLPLLAAGPALAAVTNGLRGVVGVGLLATAVAAALGLRDGVPGPELTGVLAALVAVTLAGGLAVVLRGRRERVLAAVRSVAETAQHALLKPVPAHVGPFQAAVRYSAAAAEARIGGDLYALIPTPHGVRLIVGDVRGKGLPAVGTAALVLGVFREAAHDEPDLLAVVERIERSLARNLGHDDFVTAIVAGYPPGGHLEIVNCGHTPPLLVRASGAVTPVEPDLPSPPLGLRALAGQAPGLQELPFAEGDQLLLYTDGVTEARDHGRAFYPLAEGLERHVTPEPARTLDALHGELLAHVGGRLHDDAALLLIRKPARSRTATGAGAPAGAGAPIGGGAPTGPGAPAGAEAPIGGGAPTGPGAPAGAEAPAGTEAPAGAGAPIGGGAPTGPGAPAGAEAPAGTAAPASAEAPAGAGASIGPGALTGPGAPTALAATTSAEAPAGAGAPTEPAAPTRPGAPTALAAPTSAEAPTGAGAPTGHGAPIAPGAQAAPTRPETHTTSEAHTPSEAPTATGRPTRYAAPTAPAAPDEGEAHAGPDSPDEGEVHAGPDVPDEAPATPVRCRS